MRKTKKINERMLRKWYREDRAVSESLLVAASESAARDKAPVIRGKKINKKIFLRKEKGKKTKTT